MPPCPKLPMYTLNSSDLHVWKIKLHDAKWDTGLASLSQLELEKMRRFRTRKLQLNYQRCHVALRSVLARYTTLSPSDLNFEYGEFGKPSLSNQRLHFNLSHSKGLALIAASLSPVGVDLEFIDRENIDIGELLNTVGHSTEVAQLSTMSIDNKHNFFYRLWTQKEAYFKFLGIGLNQSMNEVHFQPTNSPIASVYHAAIEHSTGLFVHAVEISAHFAASVCSSNSAPRILCMDA